VSADPRAPNADRIGAPGERLLADRDKLDDMESRGGDDGTKPSPEAQLLAILGMWRCGRRPIASGLPSF
jgi:hypothetical protein